WGSSSSALFLVSQRDITTRGQDARNDHERHAVVPAEAAGGQIPVQPRLARFCRALWDVFRCSRPPVAAFGTPSPAFELRQPRSELCHGFPNSVSASRALSAQI